MIVRGKHPRLRLALVGWAMLAPALALFITFVGWPAVQALWISLYDWTGFAPRAHWVGLRHYVNLFGETTVHRLPGLVGVLVVCVVAMAIGRTIQSSRDDQRVAIGRRISRAAGFLLAGSLLAFVLVWAYGREVASFCDWVHLGCLAHPLDWWADGDDYFRCCVRNNFTFMVVAGAFHFVYAFLFAAALNLPRFSGKVFYRTMIFFPSFISAVGVAMLWGRIYDSDYGLANFLLKLFGLGQVQWLDPDNMLNSIILIGVWAGVGSQMILLLAGMQRIPETYYEAARIDGAGEGQVFRHITLPMMRDVILIVVTLWVIGSLKVFGLFQALGGNGDRSNSVISLRQYELAFSNRDNIYMMGYATAMAVVLLVLVVVFAFIMRTIRSADQVEY